ncbi:MAG: tetratricopeptide repeat protein [Candidatus Altarchaeaceae archaeon]
MEDVDIDFRKIRKIVEENVKRKVELYVQKKLKYSNDVNNDIGIINNEKDKNKSDIEDLTDPRIWNRKGLELKNLKKFEEAIKCYDKAIELDPNYLEARNNKGVVLSLMEKFEEAIKCYDKALEINPNIPEVWNNKGVALGHLKRYGEEIRCYNKAIEINPNYPKAYYNKGIALRNLEMYEDAFKTLIKASELNPNDMSIWFELGYTAGYLMRDLEKRIIQTKRWR